MFGWVVRFVLFLLEAAQRAFGCGNARFELDEVTLLVEVGLHPRHALVLRFAEALDRAACGLSFGEPMTSALGVPEGTLLFASRTSQLRFGSTRGLGSLAPGALAESAWEQRPRGP